MAFYTLNCGTNAGNTGKQDCIEDFGYTELLLLVRQDFEIADEATALLEATYITAINADKSSRMYPLFGHFNIEFDAEGPVKQDGIAGKTKTVRAGKNKAKFIFEEIPFYNHIQLMTHNGRTDLAVLRVTSNGYIQGYSPDGIKVKGLPLSDFYVNDMIDSDGDTYNASSLDLEYKGRMWDTKGVYVKPTAFDPLLLTGVKDVSLSGTLGITGTTLTVTSRSGNLGIVGLVDANFDFHEDATPETAVAVTSTPVGGGVYTLSWADQTGNGAMTLTLFGQPIGTSGFEAAPDATGVVTGTL